MDNDDGDGPRRKMVGFLHDVAIIYLFGWQPEARGRTSETPLIIRREAALVELLLAGRVPRLSLLTLSRSAGLLFS